MAENPKRSAPGPIERLNAFICVSGKLGIAWTGAAHQAVTELGMVPFFYQGFEKEHESSTHSDAAHDALWDCDVIIVAITREEAQRPESLWIHNDLEVATRRRVPCLAYVHSNGNETLSNWIHGVPIISVADENHFGRRLREDLTVLTPPEPAVPGKSGQEVAKSNKAAGD